MRFELRVIKNPFGEYILERQEFDEKDTDVYKEIKEIRIEKSKKKDEVFNKFSEAASILLTCPLFQINIDDTDTDLPVLYATPVKNYVPSV
jgi:hypothetical protein